MSEIALWPALIETDRLRLTRPIAADAAPYMVMRAANDGIDEATAWRSFATVLGHWELRGYGFYMLRDRDGIFLGAVGLFYPADWPEIELGWHLSAEARGKGYATEAARAIRAEALGRGFAPLVSYIWDKNPASQAVAKRLGCAPEAEIELNFGHGIRHRDRVWRHPAAEVAA